MAALASDWLRYFWLLLWNCWMELKKIDRKQDLNVLYQVFVFRADRKKQDGHPGLWLAETFSTSPLKPLNGIQRNFIGSKISSSSTKFVFFGSIGKIRCLPWPLIGWNIFDFSSETAKWNSTKLDRKQDLNVLYQVWVFQADRKNKMAALAFDWLRHFRLHLWISLKNKNLVEDVEILLPVNFFLIPFSGFREEVENVSANQRPGGHLVFPIGPKNTNLVEDVEILLPVNFF